MENLQVHIDGTIKTSKATETFHFEGTGSVENGIVCVSGIVPSATTPGFDPKLASAFILTGCPIFANVHEGASNPWVKTGGEYTGIRTLDLGKRGVLNSSINAERNGNVVTMQLTICGDVTLPAISHIEKPFQEVLTPAGPGRYAGKFSMDFVDEKGNTYKADATTDYFLPIEIEPSLRVRNIKILLTSEKNKLQQEEFIDLYSTQEEATKDLLKTAYR